MHGATRDPASIMSPDPIILREISMIHKIINDETWLEGERRGCCVSPHDPVVRDSVCAVVLRIGQQLRDSLADSNSAAA